MDNYGAEQRFGTAKVASEEDIRRAGLFTPAPDAVLLGFHEGKPLYFGGQGGILTAAGARSGKLRDVLSYNLCAIHLIRSILCLDPKGELAAISRMQADVGPRGKHCVYWNPRGLHGMAQHRINPHSHIRANSPSKISDIKVFAQNAIPLTGSPSGEYFEMRAQEYMEAITTALTDMDGVLTYPRLFKMINLLPSLTGECLDLLSAMVESPYESVRRVYQEIIDSSHGSGDNSVTTRGIMGELFKSVQALSDPVLMASVSPPFDFSFEELCWGDDLYNVYLMPPAEFVGAWSSVIKSMFVCAMIYKARAPQAPSQLWILDELGQIGAFPLVSTLYTYGAGQNIRPWGVLQSFQQLNNLGPNAGNIILSSAATQQIFGVREMSTAQAVSGMCGTQTLSYADPVHVQRSQQAKRQAVHSLLGGGDVMGATLEYAHHKKMAETPLQQRRELRTADEILNTPADRQYIFTDELDGVLYCERRPYYDQKFMAGRYHPNPFHPPLDRVQVQGTFGKKWQRVITEPVPSKYAHLKQYEGGQWSYIEGYKPK